MSTGAVTPKQTQKRMTTPPTCRDKHMVEAHAATQGDSSPSSNQDRQQHVFIHRTKRSTSGHLISLRSTPTQRGRRVGPIVLKWKSPQLGARQEGESRRAPIYPFAGGNRPIPGRPRLARLIFSSPTHSALTHGTHTARPVLRETEAHPSSS